MGKRGPKPKPTILKRKAGNPGKRPLNENEPPLLEGRLVCPRWLNREQKECWKWITKTVGDMGLLGLQHLNILTRYCVAWDHWHKAIAFVREHGETYETKNKAGQTYFAQYPQIGIARSHHGILLKIETEFGMTPGSGSAVRVPRLGEKGQTPEEKQLEDWLNSRMS